MNTFSTGLSAICVFSVMKHCSSPLSILGFDGAIGFLLWASVSAFKILNIGPLYDVLCANILFYLVEAF